VIGTAIVVLEIAGLFLFGIAKRKHGVCVAATQSPKERRSHSVRVRPQPSRRTARR
jgi:hypothetical protein